MIKESEEIAIESVSMTQIRDHPDTILECITYILRKFPKDEDDKYWSAMQRICKENYHVIVNAIDYTRIFVKFYERLMNKLTTHLIPTVGKWNSTKTRLFIKQYKYDNDYENPVYITVTASLGKACSLLRTEMRDLNLSQGIKHRLLLVLADRVCETEQIMMCYNEDKNAKLTYGKTCYPKKILHQVPFLLRSPTVEGYTIVKKVDLLLLDVMPKIYQIEYKDPVITEMLIANPNFTNYYCMIANDEAQKIVDEGNKRKLNLRKNMIREGPNTNKNLLLNQNNLKKHANYQEGVPLSLNDEINRTKVTQALVQNKDVSLEDMSDECIHEILKNCEWEEEGNLKLNLKRKAEEPELDIEAIIADIMPHKVEMLKEKEHADDGLSLIPEDILKTIYQTELPNYTSSDIISWHTEMTEQMQKFEQTWFLKHKKPISFIEYLTKN